MAKKKRPRRRRPTAPAKKRASGHQARRATEQLGNVHTPAAESPYLTREVSDRLTRGPRPAVDAAEAEAKAQAFLQAFDDSPINKTIRALAEQEKARRERQVVASRPAKPPRRQVEPDDIADIRKKFKGADKQSRNWWVGEIMKGSYGVNYSPKRIAQQLKALGVPTKPTK